MTRQFFRWLVNLIATGDVHPFYVTPEWRRLSADVLREDRHECQICKARGRFQPAAMVHHVNHVKRRPDLALDMLGSVLSQPIAAAGESSDYVLYFRSGLFSSLSDDIGTFSGDLLLVPDKESYTTLLKSLGCE